MEAAGDPALLRDCPVCARRTSFELAYRKWGYPILRCAQCGLGVTAVDANFDAHDLYTEAYFQGGRSDGYGDYASSEGVLRAEFRRVVRHLERVGLSGGRLLEVGCAYGYFLDQAAARFTVSGIEICPQAAQACRARGLDVRPGVVTRELLADDEPYDAVVLLDVLEHLPDPAETLDVLWEKTNEGAHLVISTGDWDSLLGRTLGRHWRLITPPQHLHFFSLGTLTTLIERIGFRVVSYVRPSKLISLGLATYALRNRLGLRTPVLSWLNNVGIPINLFDTVRVVARREAR